MKRFVLTLTLLLLTAAVSAAGALADEAAQYRLESVSTELADTQAGAHSDFTTNIEVSSDAGVAYAKTKDVVVVLPPGLFGNPEAFPKCTGLEFGTAPLYSKCPIDSQVGSTDITISGSSGGSYINEPVYNMPTPGGDVVARFGFYAGPFQVFLDVRLDPETHVLIASVENAPSAAELVESSTTFWGIPAAKEHDPERLTPWEVQTGTGPPGGRPSSLSEVPFMTNPTDCSEGRTVGVTVRSYQLPGQSFSKTAPFPAITGCGLVNFNPSAKLSPTTTQGTSGSGLGYELTLPVKGLQFGNLLYGSEMKRAEVVLPEGMTINPSEAEGLGVCSEEDLARETYNSAPNVGCPETSKIGTVEAITPVIDRNAYGSLYLAKPYQNPFGSLIALYMVLKVPDRGVLVKLAGKVTTDAQTGRITTVFDDIPQLPVAEFHLHFREGARAPLITPAACGSYDALSNLTPWAQLGNVTARPSSFSIASGPNHSPCPTGGLPPFHPLLLAGTQNNAAGTYSPFDVELSRTDAEQEITHFSIKLPPGLVGKLAGIPLCSDSSIAAAAARKGPHGGEEELNSPSCPGASQVGTSWAGAGVGDVLTYVPGKVYLAGPYHGAPISIVNITAAKAGPFDLGTVVVREALKVDPETAQVSVDAAGSDPIPHIIQGIPVHLRDIRVYVDRKEFSLNPTNCQRSSTASTVLGAGLDFASESDDAPITVTSPFQAADCAALAFKPKLSLRLKGSPKRGKFPALTAVVRYPKGKNANIRRSVVVLPPTEFLAQGHIGTTCTRVQFNAGGGNGEQCPKRSVYGHAKAVTPLLDEPLVGPVYLRSNGGERQLPDLVAALHTKEIDIDLVGFIDSVHKRGSEVSRIRNVFAAVPDAPIKSFTLKMFGGKKGLLQNAPAGGGNTICKHRHRAISEFTGQNGKVYKTHPVVRARCGRHHKKAHRHHSKARGKKHGDGKARGKGHPKGH
jgi:hypothetical protein